MIISDEIIRYFVTQEITLSALIEDLATLTFSVEDEEKIREKITDENLLFQVEAFLSVQPNIKLNGKLRRLEKFREDYRKELARFDVIWDVADDKNGMIMLSRGSIKAAFNTGNNTLSVAPGKILASHLFETVQLEPKGFLIHKI